MLRYSDRIKGEKLESVKLNLATRLHEGSLISDAKLAFRLNYPDVSFNSFMPIAALTKILHFFMQCSFVLYSRKFFYYRPQLV